MDGKKLFISIIIMSLVTFSTRAMPFLLFGRGDKPAPIILFLGKYLPPALISVIIIYCYKDIDLMGAQHGIPELLAAAVTVGLHLKFNNTMLSIFAGTIFYMLMLRFI